MDPFADPLDDASRFEMAGVAAHHRLPPLDSSGPGAGLSLDGAHDGELRVLAFDGAEEVNALHAFDVLFLAPAAAGGDLADTSLGVRARLRMADAGAPAARVVHGIVAEIALLSTGAAERLYRLRLVPRLAALGFTRDSRVFQALSAADVVAEVLRGRRVAHRFVLSATAPPRAYCLQYEESDLDFVRRILAEEGWAFFFDHEDDGAEEVLVITDSPHTAAPLPGGDAFTVRPPSSGLAMGAEHIHAFSPVRRLAPDEISLRDHDFQRASPRAGVKLPTPTAEQGMMYGAGVSSATARIDERGPLSPLSIYEHHGQYVDVEVGRGRAAAQLAQVRARAAESAGRSTSRRFVPGRTIRVTHPEAERVDGTYLITRVVHRGRDASSPEGLYTNRFVAVEAGTLPAPPRPPRRVIQAVESAVVVGPAGQEIAPDPWGSVKVQFHWDRRGENDERSSCYLRVAQPWSGPGHGFQFVPRIGTEVLVAFLGGDPDRPVIVGSLPNAANPLPYPLPHSATQSGIRTRSTPGGAEGGHNELFFEDQAGGELVRIRAERNFQEMVLGDHQVTVGRGEYSEIAGVRETGVGGADVLQVGALQMTRVGGDARRSVGGDASDDIAGQATLHVGRDQRVTVDGTALTTVGGALLLIAGGSTKGDLQAQASGTCRVTGKDAVRIASSGGVDLLCGTTRVSLRPDGIEIRADKVKITSPEIQLGGEASELTVGETIGLSSDSILAESASARLSLNGEAVLQGDKVHLRGPEKRKKKSQEESEEELKEAVFKFVPPSGMKGPFTLRFAAPSGEVIEREADANHEVRLEGAPGEQFVLLEVRSGDRVIHHLPADDDESA